MLSNFYAAAVTLELGACATYASLISAHIDRASLPSVLAFPSTEHAWQALKADNLATFQHFLVGGRFATMDADVMGTLVAKKTWSAQEVAVEAARKVTFYSRDNLVMVGVVAKYASEVRRAKRLGYALREGCEYLPPATEAAVWHELLMAKMTQNELPRRVLLNTGGKRIVEFVKSARRMHAHWGGLVNADGSITGANTMGRFLERARAALIEQGHVGGSVPVFNPKKRKASSIEPDNEGAEHVPKRARVAPVKPTVITALASTLLIDDGAARVPYEPAFFTREEADRHYTSIMAETTWETETFTRWNKVITTPRRVFSFGDPDVLYRYISISRKGAAWTPAMLAIKARVEAYCGVTFNYCFANHYRDGQDMIGPHSDDEKALILGHKIASVSLSPDGGERDLVFIEKATKARSMVRLAHGSLYVMEGATQKLYKHAIPRRSAVTSPRINLTFRQIKPDAVVVVKQQQQHVEESHEEAEEVEKNKK